LISKAHLELISAGISHHMSILSPEQHCQTTEKVALW